MTEGEQIRASRTHIWTLNNGSALEGRRIELDPRVQGGHSVKLMKNPDLTPAPEGGPPQQLPAQKD